MINSDFAEVKKETRVEPLVTYSSNIRHLVPILWVSLLAYTSWNKYPRRNRKLTWQSAWGTWRTQRQRLASTSRGGARCRSSRVEDRRALWRGQHSCWGGCRRGGQARCGRRACGAGSGTDWTWGRGKRRSVKSSLQARGAKYGSSLMWVSSNSGLCCTLLNLREKCSG